MSTQKFFTSAELMSNYMQAETLSPDQKFEALQSEDGRSLLFSIGTDQKFYLTEEVTDHGTGWNRRELAANLASGFPSGSTMAAKTFAVDQDGFTNRFSIVLVVTVDAVDYLFVASDYTRNEEGHISALAWQAMPFDVNSQPAGGLNISEVYVLQTATVPLIVVNIIPPGKTTLERYYIDSTKSVSKSYWNLYTLPVNMDAASAQICGGRKAGEYVDGIYSMGKVGAAAAVFYQQLYNPFDPAAAGTTGQLVIPNEHPAAFASTLSTGTQNSDARYTDLYVATEEGGLYLFTAANQKNNAEGQKLINHELFQSVASLYAYTIAGRVVVWGLNRAQQVFYTECQAAGISDPGAWSYPVPIASAVEQIAPYKNRVNGGNTFFAHTGTNRLKKAMQDPVSTSWISQDILLPVEAQANAETCDSYITKITVCDGQNAPLPNTPISLSSAYRVPVYINNRYYILDTQPIDIKTDGLGAIKVVQRVENLQGARIFIHQANDGSIQTINPMDKAAAKAATLNTSDSLVQAQVTNDRGEFQKPLVLPDTDDAALDSAAASIQSLTDAYTHYNGTMPSFKKQAANTFALKDFRFSSTTRVHTLAVNGATMRVSVDDVGDALADIGDAIVVAAGDLCSWLRDATGYVIQIIEDTAQSVWNFVASVGGKVYTFIIDTVEKVIAALEAIFEALAMLIKDIIQFLKFLFDWEDIARTNAVFVNLIHLYLDYGASKVAGVKGFINEELAALIAGINDWAGLDGPNATFAEQPIDYSRTQTDYTEVYTTPNTYLQDLYIENVASSYYLDRNSSTAGVKLDTVEQLLQSLLVAMKAEGETLKLACDSLNKQLFENDKYKSMSVNEILVILTAILADTVLASAAEILDLVIDVIVDLLNAVIEELTRPIWIPVLSDFLSVLFGYTFKASHLDIICMVGAFPGTIIYKTLKQEAPFTEEDGFSSKIIEAKTYQELEEGFNAIQPDDYSKGFHSAIPLPEPAKEVIFMTGHIVSGVAASVKAVLILAEDIAELPYVPILSKAKGLFGLIQSAGSGAASLLAKPYPIQNAAISNLSTVIFYISISSEMIFSVVPMKVNSIVTKSVIAELGAAVDLLANMTAIAPVVYHFVELAETPSNHYRNLAIMDETARLSGYLSSIASDIAKFDFDPLTSTVIAVTSSGLNILNGGLQISESILDGID